MRLGERDVDRWEQALGKAHRARVDGEPQAAREGFEEALGVWRGQPFAGVSTNSLLAGERADPIARAARVPIERMVAIS